jgi:hypothetical protein
VWALIGGGVGGSCDALTTGRSQVDLPDLTWCQYGRFSRVDHSVRQPGGNSPLLAGSKRGDRGGFTLGTGGLLESDSLTGRRRPDLFTTLSDAMAAARSADEDADTVGSLMSLCNNVKRDAKHST